MSKISKRAVRQETDALVQELRELLEVVPKHQRLSWMIGAVTMFRVLMPPWATEHLVASLDSEIKRVAGETKEWLSKEPAVFKPEGM